MKPQWLKQDIPSGKDFFSLKKSLYSCSINTVCKEAHCPNIGKCWKSSTATFMVLGTVCSRNCRFCGVCHDRTRLCPPDPKEPDRIVESSINMNLAHIVITMVTRDDLPDGGATHLVRTVEAIRSNPKLKKTSIELLTSDFNGSCESLDLLLGSNFEVFAHNLETTKNLTPRIRDPKASYTKSLKVLEYVKNQAQKKDKPLFTKSGLMIGLGETLSDIKEAIQDLSLVGVDLLTVGQYLCVSQKHPPVEKYWTPTEFDEIASIATSYGMIVQSSPLVRSSFMAKEMYQEALTRSQNKN